MNEPVRINVIEQFPELKALPPFDPTNLTSHDVLAIFTAALAKTVGADVRAKLHAEIQHEQQWARGSEAGYARGKRDWYHRGHTEGYNEGLADGKREALDEAAREQAESAVVKAAARAKGNAARDAANGAIVKAAARGKR